MIDKLLSGKLPNCLHIHSYTHPIISTYGLLVHILAALQNVTDNMLQKRVSTYDCTINPIKVNLSSSMEDLVFYIILTISYLQA